MTALAVLSFVVGLAAFSSWWRSSDPRPPTVEARRQPVFGERVPVGRIGDDAGANEESAGEDPGLEELPTATLALTLFAERSRTRLAGVTVQVFPVPMGDFTSLSQEPPRGHPIVSEGASDELGTLALEVPAGVDLVALARGDGTGEIGPTSVFLPALDAEFPRELVLELPVRGPVPFFRGQLVDADSRDPLRGVEVELQRGEERLATLGCDGEGVFEVYRADFLGLTAVAHPPGRPPIVIPLAAQRCGAAGEPLRVPLGREVAQLSGVLDRDDGTPGRGRSVRVTAFARHIAYSVPGVESSLDWWWSVTVPADLGGNFFVPDLPVGLPLRIDVLDGEEVLSMEYLTEALQSGPNEVSPRTAPWRTAVRIRDADDSPIRGVEVTLREGRPLPLDPHAEEGVLGVGWSPYPRRPVYSATTDSRGRVLLPRRFHRGWIEPNWSEWSLSLDGRDWSEPFWTHLFDPRGRPLATLRTPAGARVDGIVVDDRGAPVPYAQVHGRKARWDGHRAVLADAGGRFRFPWPAGRDLELIAWARGAHRPSALHQVDGTDPVELRLAPASRLLGCVLGPDGSPCVAKVTLHPTGEQGKRAVRPTMTQDGTFLFDGLAEGTYRLDARTADGRVGSSDDFVVSPSRPGNVEVVVDRGGTLRLLSGRMPGGVFVTYYRTAGFRDFALGSVIDVPVPAGKASLYLHPRRDCGIRSRPTEIAAGETVCIDLVELASPAER